MKITITAKIVIEIDLTPKEKKPSAQTDLGSFAGMRPSRAFELRQRYGEQKRAEEVDSKPFKRPRVRRSDIGNNHHCSNCGNPGTKATKKLYGKCRACTESSPFGSWR